MKLSAAQRRLLQKAATDSFGATGLSHEPWRRTAASLEKMGLVKIVRGEHAPPGDGHAYITDAGRAALGCP